MSVLPLVIIGIASYQLSTDVITKQAISFSQEAVDRQRDALDLQLERVEDLISDISGVEEITNALGRSAKSVSSYTMLATKARIGYILNGYLNLGGLVSIDIYTLDGAHYHVGETLDAEELREDVKSKLFIETLKSGKFVYWAGVEKNINRRSPEPQVLTATNVIYEINRQTLEERAVAMLVANYSIRNFSDTLRNPVAEGGAYFVILDNKNRIIYHPNPQLIGQQPTIQLQELLLSDSTADAVDIFGKKMVVNSASFERNGWRIASFIPVAILTKPAIDIGTYTLAILGLCFAVISFTAFRYSRTVVEPIRRVIEAFKAFERGTLDPNKKILVAGDDEIAELAKWYNSFLKVVRQQQDAQDALLESENRFRDFAEASSDWFWETDVNHNFTFISDRFFETQKVNKEGIYGRSRIKLSEAFKDIEDSMNWDKHLLDLKAHKPFRVNYPFLDNEKKVIYVRTSGKPIFGENGEFEGYRGTGTDISIEVAAEKVIVDMNKMLEMKVSERTKAVREEKDRAERLVAAIDSLNEAVAIFDKEDRIIFFNRKFAELNAAAPGALEYGITFEEYLSILLSKKMLPDAIGQEKKWRKVRMKRHKNPSGMIEQAWANDVWLLMHEQRLSDGGTIILSTDITERKQLEEQVRRTQKMDAIGQLTGGVAHDFNNILGIIQGNLELLYDQGVEEAQLVFLYNAQRGIDRGADITRKLLAFSRKDVRKDDLADINTLIGNLEDLVARSLTAYVNVQTHLATGLWPVIIDEGDFEDALLNLSINARDAMPDGGTLVIETVNKTLDEDYVRVNPEGKTGDFVMISVSDTGVGMDKETKERVFEPFFTTKERGKGTGLGLSMVYGFTQRSGGHLQIYSEQGKGTTLRLFLPRANERQVGKVTNEQEPRVLPRGGETILIVDDEDELREITSRHLQNLGYNTVETKNGDHAFQLVQQRNDIDLMFSDVVMPGELDGYQLAEKVHKKLPSLKILLTSGFNRPLGEFSGDEGDYIMELTRNMLAKPYNKRELAEAIRQRLDEIGK
ncbi:MAG: response regulator [Sneathiella sp.]|nr:response regulator [Sneathiella sp.]